MMSFGFFGFYSSGKANACDEILSQERAGKQTVSAHSHSGDGFDRINGTRVYGPANFH